MCGTIRKSIDEIQAVEFALAFASYYLHRDSSPESKRKEATYFIDNYTPGSQRYTARHLLSQRPDDQLTTTLSYNWDVLE